jgi:RNA polymerase sigma-70 factor (ECF subfamily)
MAMAAVSAMLQQETRYGWRLAPRLGPLGSDRTKSKGSAQQAFGKRGPELSPNQEVRPVTLRSPQELEPGPQGSKAAAGAPLAIAPGLPVSDQKSLSPERAAALAEAQQMAELAARCLAGDPVAWEKLARTQHRRIYAICYRFIGSQSDAEDLTQEVFLKMYKNLGNFDPAKGGFNTWLTTLTRNLLVDNYRRTKMDRVSDSLDETYDGEDDGATKADKLADGGKSQEQHVAGLELRVEIQAALKQVSPELREAVILRDLEDMDYKDIAEVLGVPQGTVKSRISRGRAELARLLKRIEGQVM